MTNDRTQPLDEAFSIPARPTRVHTPRSDVEADGRTTFTLRPATNGRENGAGENGTGEDDGRSASGGRGEASGADEGDVAVSEEEIASAVARVLEADRYTVGDWFDLPVPVYLIYDRAVPTVFRVAVRRSVVELHVLPGTDGDGLSAFYSRLLDESGVGWTVSVETTLA